MTIHNELQAKDLICSTCDKAYHYELLIPKQITCEHTFCSNCVSKFIAERKKFCPKCTEPIGQVKCIDDFSNNRKIMIALKKKTTSPQPDNEQKTTKSLLKDSKIVQNLIMLNAVCFTCKKKAPYIKVCPDCEDLNCADCIAKCAEKHKLQKEYEEYQSKITNIMPIVKENKEKIKVFKAEIEEAFYKYVGRLADKKNQMLAELEEIQTDNEKFEEFAKLLSSFDDNDNKHDFLDQVMWDFDELTKTGKIKILEEFTQPKNDTENVLGCVTTTPKNLEDWFGLKMKRLILTDSSNKIQIWSTDKIKRIKTLSDHTNYVTSLRLMPDGVLLVSVSYDRSIRLFNLETGSCIKTIGLKEPIHADIEEAENSDEEYDDNDGNHGCDGGDDPDGDDVSINEENDITDEESTYENPIDDDSLLIAVEVISSTKIATGSYKSRIIRIWDLDSEQCVGKLQGHSMFVADLKLIPGNRLASSSGDRRIKIWDLDTCECVLTLRGHTHYVYKLDLMAGNKLVSGSKDKTIKLWDLNTGLLIRTFIGHTCKVNDVMVASPSRLISASDDKTIKVWNVETGQCVETLTGHKDKVNSIQLVAFNMLASGSADETIKIWDLDTNLCAQTIQIGSDVVRLKAF